MKAAFAYIWHRRWCRLMLVVIALCALPLLHPLVRQSIFGPTIDGVPWCVWENEYRRRAVQGDDPWVYKWLKKFGLISELSVGRPPHYTEALPFYLYMSRDGDAPVRCEAFYDLGRYPKEHESMVQPVLRHGLQDNDPLCRLTAAHALWSATKEAEMKSVVLPLVDHPDRQVRHVAVQRLSEMAREAPDLFDPLARLANDADPWVRQLAIGAMPSFGKRGVPVLQAALADKKSQGAAVNAIGYLGKDAEPLIPTLIQLKNDPVLRRHVEYSLFMADPKRFAEP